MIRVLPLHKISATPADYIGFSLGNQFYIVKVEADETYTDRLNYTYWTTDSKSAYDVGIENPSVLTFGQVVQEQLDLTFIFNLF